MSDLNERFRVLDRIEVPDLSPHLRVRKPGPTGPRIPLGRLASALVALAIAGIGVVLVARGFLGEERGVQRGAVPSMNRLAVVMIEGNYLGKGADSVYLVNEDGTGLERILEGRAPAWSPDGSQVAFRRGNPNRGGGLDTTIYVARADGTDVRIVVSGVSGEASGESGPPVWSPDGSLIAFDTLEGIYVVEPNGSNLRLVSRYRGDFACYDLQPSWSPDGARLAFSVLCDGPSEGLWVVNLDGSQRTQLAPPTEELVSLSQPVWSPDGSRIAFSGVTRRGSSGANWEYDIWVMNADGTDARPLTDGSVSLRDPAWSPDGSAIAYTESQSQRVMIMNADGSDPRSLTDAGFRACCPAWLPSTDPSPTPNATANEPTATAEPTGNYVFHDVGVKESTPHQAKISYWVSWSSESFPGVHRCIWTAFGEDGEVVGEFTENLSETDPPPRGANASFGLSVTDTAVSASVVCDPARLDIGNPYLHEFEVLEVTRRPISETDISWDIRLRTRWLGQGHPGVSDCRVKILDRDHEVVFSKQVTFAGELYPEAPTFSWFVEEPGDQRSSEVAAPYDADLSCRPFGSDGAYEPAPEVSQDD